MSIRNKISSIIIPLFDMTNLKHYSSRDTR